VDAIVGSGVSKQIEAFRSGFNDSFQIDDLKIITCEELVSLFGSSEEDWSLASKYTKNEKLNGKITDLFFY
jgi:E3 ubiquitin-protein ligase TRIP12